MPNPLVAFAGLVAWQQAGGIVSTISAPLSTAMQQGVNDVFPISIASPDEMINTAFMGNVQFRSAFHRMREHGIEIEMSEGGMYDVEWQNAKLTPRERYLNSTANFWGRVIQSRIYTPSIPEVLHLFNRKLITQSTANMWIQRQVGNNAATAAAWLETAYEIPGPSDLIRFAVREAFNPELIQAFGYHKEFPTGILPWMEKQGYGQNIGIPIPMGGTTGDNAPRTGMATWADLYWWSHWDLPSLTQGYEMLHRLYPSSDFGRSPDIIGDNFFTGANLEMLQKAQDIPDYWRQRLQAISYHPLNKIDVQHLFANRLIDDAGYYHALRQSGYSDANAKTLLNLGKLERDRNLGVDPAKVTKDWICEVYQSGIITERTAKDYLIVNGYNERQAEAFMANCLLKFKTKTANIQLAQLKRAYMNGVLNDLDLRTELGRIMVNQAVMQETVVQWQYLKQMKWKFPSAKEALRYYKNGIIPVQELTARLQNLEYTNAAINRMIQNANQEIATKQNAALARQIKSQLQQQKAAATLAAKAAKEKERKAQKDARIITNKAQKRLRGFIRASSDANIKAWFKDKLIELWEVYYRLYYKDYLIKDADHWVRHNMKELDEEQYNVQAKKAQIQYNREGNPPLV
jgi:hypothetical protein